ncbi:MAG: TssQ family T6SS-associated lipoprotein [Ralstonia sp.]|uniref:TssQ family T6SS-associated lipoprotein n=1 Tax=Ralstonia sp. TaxID=54061 RepID=UPI003F7E0B74
MKPSPFFYLVFSIALGTGGCATTSPTQSMARALVDSAQVAYSAGDYARTISLLGHAPEIDSANADTRIEAHKLLAFSYCVTNRVALCRSEFAKILDINPRFELTAAERGHPVWGPAFEFVRRKRAAAS